MVLGWWVVRPGEGLLKPRVKRAMLSSGRTHIMGKQNALQLQPVDNDKQNVSWCIIQSINRFCRSNHKYPRTACVDWSSVVRRNWMEW
jgi:hypothetical protein